MVPASVAATIRPYKPVLIPCGAQSHSVLFFLLTIHIHIYIDVNMICFVVYDPFSIS